jgi:hypothetical protein
MRLCEENYGFERKKDAQLLGLMEGVVRMSMHNLISAFSKLGCCAGQRPVNDSGASTVLLVSFDLQSKALREEPYISWRRICLLRWGDLWLDDTKLYQGVCNY